MEALFYRGLLIFCVILSTKVKDGYGQTLSIRCPSNQTEDAIPDFTFHQLTFPDPIVLSGGSDVTFTQNPTYFTVGITEVTFTALDSSGNTEKCSFYVNLRVPDDTPPSLICPANVTEFLNVGETSRTVTLPPPTHAVDNSGGNVAITYNPASGQVFYPGTTPVTITGTDESDNSETCVFYVILYVQQDTPPVVTCPPNQVQDVTPGRTGQDCYVVVNYPEATATDESTVSVSGYPASGSQFDTCTYPDGQLVVVTATDAIGNSAICTFWISWSGGLTTMSAPTTGRPATTIKPTTGAPTTRPTTTTRPPTTTKQPTTTRPPTTTTQPTTTRPPTTTTQPTTTRPQTTTKQPTTTRPPTTTKQPTTTRPPTTTTLPTTTRPTTTTLPPTTRPSTTTKSPTTTKPSTTTRSPTTTRPPTTTKSPTTTRPPTTTKSPTTTRPPTTTSRPTTTRPTTKPTTTAPAKTTKRMTTKGRPLFTDFNICSPNPCHNNGLCLSDATNSIISCVCLHGYMGSRCEVELIMSTNTLNTTKIAEENTGPPMSAIIAVIIGALAFILCIFIILTCIICCYNKDTERPVHASLKEAEAAEGNQNPVFILDALDVDDDEKASLASHELVHVDNEYHAEKQRKNVAFRLPDGRLTPNEVIRPRDSPVVNTRPTPATPTLSANKPTVSAKRMAPTPAAKPTVRQHIPPVRPSPLVEFPPDDTNGDNDEVASTASDHSYQSIDAATKHKIVVEVDNHLAEEDKEEAEREAAMLEELLNKEGLVRIPSTVSTNYSTMSVKLRNSRLNDRYMK